MADIRQQAGSSASSGGADAATGFCEKFSANISATGLSPRKTICGFVLAWALFFLILYGMSAPAGMSAAGQATLAVMVWACTMWIFEAIPVGISGRQKS